jgi:hypothetical protein
MTYNPWPADQVTPNSVVAGPADSRVLEYVSDTAAAMTGQQPKAPLQPSSLIQTSVDSPKTSGGAGPAQADLLAQPNLDNP